MSSDLGQVTIELKLLQLTLKFPSAISSKLSSYNGSASHPVIITDNFE